MSTLKELIAYIREYSKDHADAGNWPRCALLSDFTLGCVISDAETKRQAVSKVSKYLKTVTPTL